MIRNQPHVWLMGDNYSERKWLNEKSTHVTKSFKSSLEYKWWIVSGKILLNQMYTRNGFEDNKTLNPVILCILRKMYFFIVVFFCRECKFSSQPVTPVVFLWLSWNNCFKFYLERHLYFSDVTWNLWQLIMFMTSFKIQLDRKVIPL